MLIETNVPGISTIRSLRDYLKAKRPSAYGAIVANYTIRYEKASNDLKVLPVVVQHLVWPDGRHEARFYGYLPDVLHNIECGIFDKEE